MTRLDSALDACPSVRRLALAAPKALEKLVLAWNVGALSATFHPLIELILGDNHRMRRHALEASVRTLEQAGVDLHGFAARVVTPDPKGFYDAASALTELYVGGRLALVGAAVRFIQRTQQPTPDLEAKRNGSVLTMEVASLNSSSDLVAKNNDLLDKFRSWRVGQPIPAELRGQAFEHRASGGSVRVLTYLDAPMGRGTPGQMAGRIAGKKDPGRQLGRWPNPVLVLSFWHKWGVSRRDCQPTYTEVDGSTSTGLLYAASYGSKGDAILRCQEFEGDMVRATPQSRDGVLKASRDLCALVWLFQEDAPVIWENTLPGATTLDTECRSLLLDALDLHGDQLSRLAAP